jgi:hypothetical protein
MERHGAELERDACDDEGEAEHEAELVGARLANRNRELIELQRPCQAVNDRESVEHRSRCDRAEHEVFHRAFCGHIGIAIDRDHRIERQRQQLDAEIDRHETAGGRHDHDAEQRDERQDEVLALEQAAADEVLARIYQRDADRAVGKQLQHVAHRIRDERAAECAHAGIDREIQRHDGCTDERQQRQCVRHPATAIAQKHIDEQDHADRTEQEDLGGGRGVFCC